MIRRYFRALVRYLRTPPNELADDVTQSIEEEIETHLAHSVDEQLARGLSGDEARRAAYDQFGQISPAVRGCHEVWQKDQLVFHRLHLLLTGGLVSVVVMGLLFGRALFRDTPPSSTAAANLTGDLRGRVVDERSAPIERAHILAVVKTWPDNGYRQQAYMTTTGPDGTFAIVDICPADEPFEVQLAVVADERLLESVYVSDARGELKPFEFQLQPTSAFSLRFRGPDGRPMTGVEVFPHRRVDRAGHDYLVYFQSAEPIVQRSNAEGEVRMPYFRQGDQATVYFRTPGGEWRTRDVTVPDHATPVVLAVGRDEQVTQSDDAKGI